MRGQFSDTEPFVIVEAGDRGRPLKCDFHLQWLYRMLNVQRSVQIARRLGGSKRWTPLLIWGVQQQLDGSTRKSYIFDNIISRIQPNSVPVSGEN